MTKKAASKISSKVPSSKGREMRIKKCEVPGCNGNPKTQEYTAEPFKGTCCSFCFEIVTVELIEKTEAQIKSDDSTKGDSKADRKVSRGTSDFDDDGPITPTDNNFLL